MFQAEPLPTAVALVRLLPCVDAFMAPQRAVISETAPAEFTLKRVIARVRAQVSFEGSVAGEGALTVATDVAVHACVDLHVLLQGLLGLEALCTQQTEHRHVSPCVRLPVGFQSVLRGERRSTLIAHQRLGRSCVRQHVHPQPHAVLEVFATVFTAVALLLVMQPPVERQTLM